MPLTPYHARLGKGALQSTVGRVWSVLKGAPQHFFILTNGRTGSNLLVKHLNEHPEIRVHSEVFGEFQLEDLRIRRMINRLGPTTYLKRASARLTTETHVGHKMLYYQLENEYGLKRGVENLASIKSQILDNPDHRFIHLRRKNHLARIISNRLALSSDNWGGGEYKRTPIEIDLDWAQNEFARMAEWEDMFDKLLPADRTLDFSYEELVAAPQAQMDVVFAHIGVQSQTVNHVSRKQNTRPHSETVSNFQAMTEHFRKTPYAKHFADEDAANT